MRPLGAAAAVVAVVVAWLATSAGTASAGLMCGAVITSPGSYSVSTDLNCSAVGNGAAFDVQVDGTVTINLNGHTVSGPGTLTGSIGFLVEGSHDLHVANGVVRGFGSGVATYVPGVIGLDNVRIAKNGVGLVGIASHLELRRSYINENTADGIDWHGDGGISIFDSQVAGNGRNGITDDETPLDAERNVIARNHGYGILNSEFGVVLRDNQVNTNGLDGVLILRSFFPYDTYVITNNTAVGNGGHGIVYEADSDRAPIHATDFEGNVAHDNSANPQCINIFCRTT